MSETKTREEKKVSANAYGLRQVLPILGGNVSEFFDNTDFSPTPGILAKYLRKNTKPNVVYEYEKYRVPTILSLALRFDKFKTDWKKWAAIIETGNTFAFYFKETTSSDERDANTFFMITDQYLYHQKRVENKIEFHCYFLVEGVYQSSRVTLSGSCSNFTAQLKLGEEALSKNDYNAILASDQSSLNNSITFFESSVQVSSDGDGIQMEDVLNVYNKAVEGPIVLSGFTLTNQLSSQINEAESKYSNISRGIRNGIGLQVDKEYAVVDEIESATLDLGTEGFKEAFKALGELLYELYQVAIWETTQRLKYGSVLGLPLKETAVKGSNNFFNLFGTREITDEKKKGFAGYFQPSTEATQKTKKIERSRQIMTSIGDKTIKDRFLARISNGERKRSDFTMVSKFKKNNRFLSRLILAWCGKPVVVTKHPNRSYGLEYVKLTKPKDDLIKVVNIFKKHYLDDNIEAEMNKKIGSALSPDSLTRLNYDLGCSYINANSPKTKEEFLDFIYFDIEKTNYFDNLKISNGYILSLFPESLSDDDFRILLLHIFSESLYSVICNGTNIDNLKDIFLSKFKVGNRKRSGGNITQEEISYVKKWLESFCFLSHEGIPTTNASLTSSSVRISFFMAQHSEFAKSFYKTEFKTDIDKDPVLKPFNENYGRFIKSSKPTEEEKKSGSIMKFSDPLISDRLFLLHSYNTLGSVLDTLREHLANGRNAFLKIPDLKIVIDNTNDNWDDNSDFIQRNFTGVVHSYEVYYLISSIFDKNIVILLRDVSSSKKYLLGNFDSCYFYFKTNKGQWERVASRFNDQTDMYKKFVKKLQDALFGSSDKQEVQEVESLFQNAKDLCRSHGKLRVVEQSPYLSLDYNEPYIVAGLKQITSNTAGSQVNNALQQTFKKISSVLGFDEGVVNSGNTYELFAVNKTANGSENIEHLRSELKNLLVGHNFPTGSLHKTGIFGVLKITGTDVQFLSLPQEVDGLPPNSGTKRKVSLLLVGEVLANTKTDADSVVFNILQMSSLNPDVLSTNGGRHGHKRSRGKTTSTISNPFKTKKLKKRTSSI